MEDMARNTHLQKRGNVYYFRYRIPSDLVEMFGKPEIKHSLKTKDLREAKTLLAVSLVEAEREFDEARGRRVDERLDAIDPTSPQSSVRHVPSPKEYYDQVRLNNDTYRESVYSKVENDQPGFLKGKYITLPRTKWYYHLYEEGDWEKILGFCFSFEVEDRLKELTRARGVGDFKEHKALANNDLKIGLMLLEAEIKALKNIQARYRGSDPGPDTAEISPPTFSLTNNAAKTSTAPLLSEAAKEWFSEKRKGVSEKIIEGYQARIREFIAIIGDKRIDQYTKAHVREFKAVLEKLPPNWSKQQALKGLTARQVAKKTTAITNTLSPTTIKDILVICSRCFNWFVANRDDIDINPFTGIKVEGKHDVRNERKPFSVDDLKKIFASLRFKKFDRTSAMYWVPIIGLFTGMRLGEICQLYASDVRSDENDISYFDNNTNQNDKKLKSNTARRRIPIHQVLTDLGFLEFVKKRSSLEGDARLQKRHRRSLLLSIWKNIFQISRVD